ncbi:MAG: hypothetical protein JXA24_05320 [Proteobacteria bacterium]|nr:hypothetical protein [Pseudomonadota bacterium]
MKRRAIIIAALAAVAALAALDATAAPRGGGGKKSLKIQVREIQVKSAPNYLSSTVGSLGFGAVIEVTGEEGNWYRIASPAGFVPKNATGKKSGSVESSERYAAKGVTHDETALAGKGFNPQVEGQYKKSSASLAAAYRQVDRVDAIRISDGELSQFLAQGKLNR